MYIFKYCNNEKKLLMQPKKAYTVKEKRKKNTK